MKVLQLTPDVYFPAICGNAFVIDDFSRLVLGLGGESYVMVDNKCDLPCYYKHSGATVFNPSGDQHSILKSVEAIVEAEGIDLIIVHDGDYPKFDLLFESEKLRGIKKIILHHYLKYEHQVKADLDRYDAVVVFQDEHLRVYKEDYRFKSAKIFTIYHPVSETFRQATLDHLPDPLLAVYAGRLARTKGVHELVPHLDLLGIKFTAMGPSSDPAYVEELRALERENPHFKLIVGEHSHDEILKLFKSAGIFFIGSTSECYSLVAQEAMATGMKVVAKDNLHAFTWAGPYINLYSDEGDELFSLMTRVSNANQNIEGARYIRDKYNFETAKVQFQGLLRDLNQDKAEDDGEIYSSYMRIQKSFGKI